MRKYFIFLVVRVLVRYVFVYKVFKDIIIYYFLYENLDKMVKKFEEVCNKFILFFYEMNILKIIYFNCGVRYEGIDDYRSYIYSVKLKFEKI